MVYERVDDVPQDEGPGAPQALLHLPQQQAHQQVVHQQDAVALVAVGRRHRLLAQRQQDPLDEDLGGASAAVWSATRRTRKGEHMEEGKREGFQFCINFEGVFTDIDS